MEKNLTPVEQITGMHGLPTKTIKLCEAVFDLAFTAGYKTGKGELPAAEDSREAFAAILDLAYHFELDAKEDDDDYMVAIDKYADANLDSVFAQLTAADASENIVEAYYVTKWDTGLEVATHCKVNMATKQVFDIEAVDLPELEVLEAEFIRFLDGNEEDVYTEDDIEKPKDAYWHA